jgi:2-oxoglutarate dehydrogenase E2 component (dihydrolipoamide succinyltransferase)
MPTPVLMPQMGESIAEGTIVRWMKKVGDHVDRDEPLFEISTDKVDAEIPSPAAGVLIEIRVKEGETVPVESVVASIGLAEESLEDESPEQASSKDESAVHAPAQPPLVSDMSPPTHDSPGQADPRRRKSSPLVRRIAREHQVDVSQLSGSGLGGRVTKTDILGFLESGETSRASASHQTSAGAIVPAFQPGERVEIKPLSVMRRKIAEHMVLSRRTSAHVHTVFHVNCSRIEGIRQHKKAAYEQAGARLTYMAFIAKACVDALRRYPIINASIDGDNVIFKQDINLGIAVALESGLLVPVVKHADEKSMLGLSRAIVDVADRARAKQLTPDDVHGGTFTITNPGQSGAQFGLPIISQPQVAILGMGTIEKRPVVVDDAIAIRTMAYLTLGFDHRLVDGAVADQFMADVKAQLENFDADQV